MTREQEEYFNEGLEIGRKERDEVLKVATEFLRAYNAAFGPPEKWNEYEKLSKLLLKYNCIKNEEVEY